MLQMTGAVTYRLASYNRFRQRGDGGESNLHHLLTAMASLCFLRHTTDLSNSRTVISEVGTSTLSGNFPTLPTGTGQRSQAVFGSLDKYRGDILLK